MMSNNIGIYNHNLGEQIVREMTNDEQAERDAEIATWQTKQQAKADAEAEAASKKAAAQAKLGALGLTADDLKALGLV